MTEPLLQMRGIGMVFHKDEAPVTALADVDLDIGHGDYVALVGPSGSGKSTLLALLGCLDRPTGGSYRFDGVDTAGLSARELAAVRRRIGFVFQSFHLLPGLTAAQNVALPLRYADCRPAERARRAAAMLQKVGLADRTHHLPRELSGGQQQRVAIARALVVEPLLLLADEPTGNLDSRSGAEITELLENLWRAGQTVIVVTHDGALAARAQRQIRLHDGRLVAAERA
jgi:putative ABC transport system ATP-binding protein